MSPRERLQTAVALIEQIQQQLQKLYAIVPDLRSNDSIAQSINRCHAVFQQAGNQLARPALRIATIGTTSAGKSTLVNGLIGRQIAPMDASELSAGVLHLVHALNRRLWIKPVEGYWEGIDRADLSDNEMYEHVRERVFKKYHEEKQKHTISVPEIRIEGPLLPAAWPELLNLPENVGIEIYDLPGLNSVADKTNLAVIQSHLKQCFSLVVMDYGHTDTSNRANLLKEIAEVVNALGGRTDTLLFALNRVDLRKQTDDSLKDRLEDFSKAIQQQLKLSELPEIVPISGISLFHAQCAWGWSKPEGEPVTDFEQQKACLQRFMSDCSSFIAEHQKGNREIKNWFRDIDDAVEEGNDIPDELLATEKLSSWVSWSWKHSGGADLWVKLEKRIAAHFAEVVIAPILITPFAELKIVLSHLNEYDNTQRLENKAAVEQKRIKLQQQFEDLRNFLSRQNEEYQSIINQATVDLSDAMRIANPAHINWVLRCLFSLSPDESEPDVLKGFRELEGEIKQDLIDQVLIPVRDYFKKGELSYELSEKLKTLTPETRKAICHAAERYRERGMTGDAITQGINKQVRQADSQAVRELNRIKDSAVALFSGIRQGFAERALYLLQSHHTVIEALQLTLRNRGVMAIEDYLKKSLPDEASALLAHYQRDLAEIPLGSLSDSMFDIPIEGVSSERITEQTGTRNVVNEVGSCFKKDEVTQEPIYDNIPYVKLNLPGIDQMAAWWQSGIDVARSGLWKAFGDWFAQSADEQYRLFLGSANTVHKQLTDLLDSRLKQNEEDYQFRLQKLDELRKLCEYVEHDAQKLRQTSITGSM